MLDKDMKEKWLAALRSGDYPKGEGYLSATDDEGNLAGFCCLGVFADLFYEEPWVFDSIDSCRTKRNMFATLDEDFIPLPVQRELAYRNDHSETFDSVIKYIEENL